LSHHEAKQGEVRTGQHFLERVDHIPSPNFLSDPSLFPSKAKNCVAEHSNVADEIDERADDEIITFPNTILSFVGGFGPVMRRDV
jgi:hypothetical protein